MTTIYAYLGVLCALIFFLVFPIKLGLTVFSWVIKKYFRFELKEQVDLLKKENSLLNEKTAELEGRIEESRRSFAKLNEKKEQDKKIKKLESMILECIHTKNPGTGQNKLFAKWKEYENEL